MWKNQPVVDSFPRETIGFPYLCQFTLCPLGRVCCRLIKLRPGTSIIYLYTVYNQIELHIYIYMCVYTHFISLKATYIWIWVYTILHIVCIQNNYLSCICSIVFSTLFVSTLHIHNYISCSSTSVHLPIYIYIYTYLVYIYIYMYLGIS